MKNRKGRTCNQNQNTVFTVTEFNCTPSGRRRTSQLMKVQNDSESLKVFHPIWSLSDLWTSVSPAVAELFLLTAWSCLDTDRRIIRRVFRVQSLRKTCVFPSRFTPCHRAVRWNISVVCCFMLHNRKTTVVWCVRMRRVTEACLWLTIIISKYDDMIFLNPCQKSEREGVRESEICVCSLQIQTLKLVKMLIRCRYHMWDVVSAFQCERSNLLSWTPKWKVRGNATHPVCPAWKEWSCCRRQQGEQTGAVC